MPSFRLTSITMPRWEAILTRVFLAWLLWKALPNSPTSWTEQPHPVALGQWLDCTWTSNPVLFERALLAAKAGLLFFALGIFPIFGLCAFLVLDISLHTLASSQGFQGHAAQLNAMMALGMVVAYLWHSVTHWRGHTILHQPLICDTGGAATTALQGARIVLASSYVVSGLSKITRGGLDWPTHGNHFVLQILKAQDEIRATHIHPHISESAIAFGEYLTANPWLATVMLFIALSLELGAFIALFNRRLALFFGAGLYTFHECNDWLMGLPFNGNQWALLFLFIMPLFWMVKVPTVLIKGRKTATYSPVFLPHAPVWQRILRHPATISVLTAFFLLWRKDWYPFSHFPMYSKLSKSTTSLLATDFEGKTIPFMSMGTNAPNMKKLLRTELLALVKEGRYAKVSEIPLEEYEPIIERLVHILMKNSYASPRNRELPSFRLIQKNYLAKQDSIEVTSRVIGEYHSRSGIKRSPAGEPAASLPQS